MVEKEELSGGAVRGVDRLDRRSSRDRRSCAREECCRHHMHPSNSPALPAKLPSPSTACKIDTLGPKMTFIVIADIMNHTIADSAHAHAPPSAYGHVRLAAKGTGGGACACADDRLPCAVCVCAFVAPSRPSGAHGPAPHGPILWGKQRAACTSPCSTASAICNLHLRVE